MKKSSKKMMIDKKFVTKVEEEAINEKMKVLEVKKKAEESEDEENELIKLEVKKMAEESVNPADIVWSLYEESLYRRFRAESMGSLILVPRKEALREHFKECGSIKRIRVKGVAGFRYALIDFTSQGSLNNALKLNNTRVDGHPDTVTVQSGIIFHNSNFKFRALISGFHDIDLNALTQHFETTCGGIAGIRYKSTCVWIDFTCLESLNKALELDKITFDKQCIRVNNCISRWYWSRSCSVA
ncbi:hypothetical protein OROMI_032064 [Orobanche minor]